ncbi:MAG: type III pantothenate kinase [Ardenticatenia bacterium]|nr:MAG: type III pantothenate kinase [Ardenticatenia bacterium]
MLLRCHFPFDVVSPEGAYIGGVIAPGLQLSASALFSRAARLFKVDFVFPPRVIGNTSATAMQSGLMWGYASLIEGIVARIAAELGAQPTVIATGGLAEAMAEHTACIDVVDQALTVDGLYEIWKRHHGS